ncbi:hypothetical protein A2V61_02500 [Candidatus Woesebacteria bacterium RBG_19FT_COMBO_47_8]|uniref:Uncharacterized protein n=1 Tax=Candidatus Woesebacteria bacterium RBG_13_46_13 TaxID=1802479 RepID=A0A1F7X6F1_9BACT|nr:MAG: hypothetical protein A2Y68_00780 [Candidatus Woesebacteria bacterium RBG_13_46_13]OGM17184.1 MAG: hypothetical protein A2V61_02500 [Candidatus Woesebacteria bacterium RBG_19FT_COMBO_47_8]HJX59450.1 hypothetical protein [Patescibacteria group bacterium]
MIGTKVILTVLFNVAGIVIIAWGMFNDKIWVMAVGGALTGIVIGLMYDDLLGQIRDVKIDEEEEEEEDQ